MSIILLVILLNCAFAIVVDNLVITRRTVLPGQSTIDLRNLLNTAVDQWIECRHEHGSPEPDNANHQPGDVEL